MEIIRQNRLIAAILGGLVVVAALVLIFNDDPDSGPGIPANITPLAGTAPATVATTEAPALTRPDVRTLKCDTLLPSDAVQAALGNPRGWGTTALAEDCSISTDESSATIQIAPGSPADFDPGAQIFGVPGTPVEGVGDLALWFGGPTANGDGGVGAIVVAAESEIGALIFRIAVGRPDLDPDAQLEIAKTLALAALPRFPGVVPAPPEATPTPEATPLPVVEIEHEPVDTSNRSYVDNLLAREADGEWTRGEGLIATLQHLAGELDAAEVLRSGPVIDEWDLNATRLAADYLAANPNAEEAGEIQRLLGIVAPQPVLPPAAAAAAASGPAGAHRPVSLVSTRQTDDDCYVPFPDAQEVCFARTTLDGTPEGDQFIFWVPIIEVGESWEGWVRGEADDTTILDGLLRGTEVIAELDGTQPRIHIWLTPGSANSIEFKDELCIIGLGASTRGLEELGAAYVQQALASAVARCYLFANFGYGEHAANRWWEDGIALYLSDVAFPAASWEADIRNVPGELERSERTTGVLQRSTTNLAYFESIAPLNPQDAVDAAANMALTGLDSVPRIERDLHSMAEALTDGVFFDQDGLHPYRPRSFDWDVTSEGTTAATPAEFGIERLHLAVDSGMYACLDYPDAGNLDLLVTWRAGAPGEFGEWSGDLPPDIQGDVTFLVSTIVPDGQFRISVTSVTEDPEDCEEEQQTESAGEGGSGDSDSSGGATDEEDSTVPIPEPPCGGCPRTSFYSDWDIPGF